MCMGWTTARESGNQVKSRFIGVVTVALLSFNGQTGTLARARDTRLPGQMLHCVQHDKRGPFSGETRSHTIVPALGMSLHGEVADVILCEIV